MNQSFSSPEALYLEGMTSVSAAIRAADAGTSYRKILTVYFDRNKAVRERGRFGFIRAAAARLGFDVRLSSAEEIDALANGRTHGGILAEVTPANYPAFSADDAIPGGFAAIIEGAEDPYSLGYSIRSLYACGADLLILPRRFPEGADGVIARASAGASELMKIYLSDTAAAADILAGAGYRCVSAGIRDSVPCMEADLKRPVMIAVGGEKRGITQALAEKCSCTVRIPYGREFMGSLSTASSVAVLAYEILRQNSGNS